jgi:hypothetical protein
MSRPEPPPNDAELAERILLNTVRRERTMLELASLTKTIGDWVELRRLQDRNQNRHYVGRHKTQLDTLESVLKTALKSLQESIGALGTSTDCGQFFDNCRGTDEATVWLERFWRYFQEKFDQRDDPRLGPIVHAADELVWSCYHEVMDRARQRDTSVAHGPSPLAYVAPEYSPAALESDSPLTGDLSAPIALLERDKVLKEIIDSLPLPLLRLPPWCIDAPWWLIYVAHEVGHHVATDLNLIRWFGEKVQAEAEKRVGEEPAKRWRSWSEEIFADIFSVVAVGRWALWAVADVEWTTFQRLTAPRARYPSPVLRFAIMARAVDLLGEQSVNWIRPIPDSMPGGGAEILPENVRETADAVARLALGPLPGTLGTLKDLIAYDHPQFNQGVKWWASQLPNTVLPPFNPELPTARQLIAGSVSAWSKIASISDEPTRTTQRVNLAQRTREALRQSGPPGTRGGEMPSGNLPDKGVALAARLQAIAQTRVEQQDP